jgi:asparagine synthase (glutamine-hydrolysing)
MGHASSDARVDRAPDVRGLAEALRSAAARCVDGANQATVLYSGGLDSSLVAHLLNEIVPVQLLVIGTEGSQDRAAARAGAAMLSLPLEEVAVTRTDLDEALRRFPEELDGLREPLRSVDVALAIAFRHVAGPRVALGQGADELFYGYAHFRGLSPAAARQRAEVDWSLLEGQEWPRSLRISRVFGLDLVSPFLDAELVRYAWSLDPPGPGDSPKEALRAAARELGVPEPLASAPKRALQYGSGVHRLLQRGAEAAESIPSEGRRP